MKKVLFASTAMLLSGGMAMADVTISGNGRFGLEYNEQDSFIAETDEGPATIDPNETTISLRLRFNIDASKETDSGVTFGGRIRMQYASGDSDYAGESGAGLSAAKLYASYGGMRLEAGNVDTAYDSAALMYNSEMGFKDSSAGDPQGSFYSFNSTPYGIGQTDRMGVAFTYSVDAFNVRLSWVNADQTRTITDYYLTDEDAKFFEAAAGFGYDDEYGISADYTFDAFTISGAAVMNGNGISDNDQFFLGGEYAFADVGAVGLQYFDNGQTQEFTYDEDGFINGVTDYDVGSQFTLYGNYKFDQVIVRGYISNLDNDDVEDSTVYGIGADYDLGGATLSGSVRSGYNGNYSADVGVKFTF
ncbi:MAG: hypothetical protein DI533_19130 [Cereibacter sphaeroides]|uniref:Porin domain-containing protein n=1 Tax=Cereibacter sphaeroides TaxID=1063 RepID=A0A2W5TXC1_CERSP|nr:MAG: hypothetical protein DI533_19130 [Cereibacter sphaeroides]